MASFADCARRPVQFMIEHALLFIGQAAAVLCGHIARFLAYDVKTMVQCVALGRWVIASVDMPVDAAAEIVDATVDLTETLQCDLARVRAQHRCGRRYNDLARRRWLIDDAGAQRRDQCAASERANHCFHRFVFPCDLHGRERRDRRSPPGDKRARCPMR